MRTSIRMAGAVVLSAAASAYGAAAAVTPSGDTVPENLLRIELHLARPLARPLAMDHVRLLDERGVVMAGAFLDLPLPGDDGRTITLLLHPGRVKTGVGANLALGRALHDGADVTLVVDDPQLAAPLRKRWHVGAAIDAPLQSRPWRIDPPRAGTRAPLRVWTDAPLTASSARLVAVCGPDGERVDGVAALRSGETAWSFVPARPWRSGPHALVLHPRLEDVAGNRPCTPFEATDLSERACRLDEPGFEPRP